MKKDSFAKKLAGYIAMSSAFLAAQKECDAQIIYHDVSPDDSLNNFNQYFFEHSFIDLNNDGIYDYKFDAKSPYTGDLVILKNDLYNINEFSVYPFNLNNSIGNSVSFGIGSETLVYGFWSTNQYGMVETGYWVNSFDSYLAVKFFNNSQINYGWIRLDVNVPSSKITIKDFAYNSVPDSSILAGDKGCNGQTLNPLISELIGDTLISTVAMDYQWTYNGAILNGETSQFIEATNDGNYAVIITDSIGCRVQSNLFYKGICPNHFIHITASDSVICPYQDVHFNVDSLENQNGYTINWYKNSNEYQLFSNDIPTNLNIQFSPADSGNIFCYSIFRNPINQCADTSNQISITVHPQPLLPILSQNQDSIISLPNSNYIYTWYLVGSFFVDTTTVNYFLPFSNGTYQVLIEDSNGCKRYSNDVYFDGCYYMSDSISATGLKVGCNIDSVILTAEFYPNTTYVWPNGVMGTNSISITNAGIYDCYIFDTLRQCAIHCDTVEIINIMPPEVPLIYQNGDTLYTGAYYSYQWYLNGNLLPGEIHFYIVPQQQGNYSVEVFNEGGCYSFSANFESVNEIQKEDIKIIVEENFINIFYKDEKLNGSEVQLVNVLGQVLNKSVIENKVVKITIRNLPKGVYLINIKTKVKIFSCKISIE